MPIQRLSLRDFRSYTEAEFVLSPGVTVVAGRNGTGKTNLLEAIGYLATLRSFRGSTSDALTKVGTDRAVLRCEIITADQRSVLIETEIVLNGRSRTLVNKQTLKRSRDLAEVLRISVFSPKDLVLVKGGPSHRRDWLDEALTAEHPRYGALVDDVNKILKQRNALLKQIATFGKGKLDEAAALTLDVWDTKLAESGAALVSARITLLNRLREQLAQAYIDIAESPLEVRAVYDAAWIRNEASQPTEQSLVVDLAAALVLARADEVRRGVSLAGPHRDDVMLELIDNGISRPSRTHASQGEQRTLALSMRLAVHRNLTSVFGEAPLLLLDDVFSELDPFRSGALVRHLPVGQAVLATATGAPEGVVVDAILHVERPAGSSVVSARVGPVNSSLPVGNIGDSVDGFALENMK